ncbi:hypothetical protein M3Y95_00672000 [Aphelenchoides besseyi]|nr:hypothetical protein M3Y95_00672000 [Aphelenchoides besseyi]
MNATKIAENPPLTDDETYQATRNGDKIWLFQEKYEDQVDYHYGHRVLNAGSLAISFDTKTNKWNGNKFADVSALVSQNEQGRLDEIVFTFAGSIFLLLFNRFEGLRLESLWKFDEEKIQWTKHSDINKVIEPSGDDHTFGNKLLLVKDSADTHGPFFVAKINGAEQRDYVVFQLVLNEVANVEDVHRIRNLHDVLPVLDPLPFAAIRVDNKIFISVAEHGCGYRWRTEEILKFDIQTKELTAVQVGHENPTFGLYMATTHVYDSQTGSWIFFGSPSRFGRPKPSDEEQKPEVSFYAITQLDSDKPIWKQSDRTVQDAGRDDLYIPSSSDQSVYVINRKYGTLNVPWGEFKDIPRRNDEL